MRVNEPTGIFHIFQDVSPEAIKAQRMAELNDLAEYRARHLKAIIDWSDPVKRAARIAEAALELERAQKLAQEMKAPEAQPLRRLEERIKVTPIAKPQAKASRMARFLDWCLRRGE